MEPTTMADLEAIANRLKARKCPDTAELASLTIEANLETMETIRTLGKRTAADLDRVTQTIRETMTLAADAKEEAEKALEATKALETWITEQAEEATEIHEDLANLWRTIRTTLAQADHARVIGQKILQAAQPQTEDEEAGS